MGWYEAIKDGIKVAQKADNIPLVNSLKDAQMQILDLVNENHRLKTENLELKTNKIQLENIERHKDTYITLKDDEERIIYCSCCFDKEQKLIQAQTEDDGSYYCPACKYKGYYDKKKYDYMYSDI